MSPAVLQNFDPPLTVALIGASGGIGSAFLNAFQQDDNIETIYAFSRSALDKTDPKTKPAALDYSREDSVAKAVRELPADVTFDLIVIAAGLLHDQTLQPEKSLKGIDLDNFTKVFAANTFGPALVAKYFLPRLKKDSRAVFAALSARVGSIADNRIGGWYAYRSSKAALNMIIKCASIEMGRRYKKSVIIGLHPGTVDTALSEPFQGHVKPEKLFTPEYAADCLIKVINKAGHEDSGKVFAWDGGEIPC